MATANFHTTPWDLARRQHGVIARRQLVAFGYSEQAIRHRLAKGRLHRVHPGVYALGRPEVTQHGRWMAAILAAGPAAVLSHRSAAALYGIAKQKGNAIHVAVPAHSRRRSSRGITVHTRNELRATASQGVPVTTPEDTLIDLATDATQDQLEQAINEADKRDLIDPPALREAAATTRRRGAASLRAVLDRHTRTDSPLERAFLRIAKRAGLPPPQTQACVNGHRVDFYWPELALVVETDGLRYHRTAAEQAADRKRDQDHFLAGLTALRFTTAQLDGQRGRVEEVLRRARHA
jgi:predicted transcriptional regulator of viral defense system